MATFPTIDTHVTSSLTPLETVNVEQMASGRPKARVFGSNTVYEYTLIAYVAAADIDTVLSFWDTNKALTFTYNFPGDYSLVNVAASYTGIFVRRPTWDEAEVIGQRRLQVDMVLWE